MAKEYRWFKISEANAEIDRLEKELQSAKASAAAAVENDSEIANQASRLQAEVDSLKGQVSERDATIATLTSERDAAKAEATKAKTDADAAIKATEEKVAKVAAEKALQITAAQGQPPISAKQSENPSAAPKAELTGLARVRAAFEAELAAKK